MLQEDELTKFLEMEKLMVGEWKESFWKTTWDDTSSIGAKIITPNEDKKHLKNL